MEWLECCSCIDIKNIIYNIKGKSDYIQLLYMPSHVSPRKLCSRSAAVGTVVKVDKCWHDHWGLLIWSARTTIMAQWSTLSPPQYLHNVDTLHLHITQYVWWEHNITELTTPCIPDIVAKLHHGPLLNNKTYFSVCGKIVTSHNILKALIFVNFSDIKIRFWQLLMVMFFATKKCRMVFSTLTNFQDWVLVRNWIVDETLL